MRSWLVLGFVAVASVTFAQQQRRGRMHRAQAHLGGVERAPVRIHDGPERLEAMLTHHVVIGEDEHRRAVGDLRRVPGGVHAVLAGDGLERRQLLERGLAQAFVAGAGVCGVGEGAVFVAVGGLDGDDLAGEAVFLPRTDGALLAGETETVGVVAGDAPFVGDALGTLELRRHLVLAEVRLRDRHTETEFLLAARTDRHAAHDLDTAGKGDVDDARTHERCGKAGGLLRGTALRVHGGGSGGDGKTGSQPRGACEVECLLADLADAATDDLLKQCWSGKQVNSATFSAFRADGNDVPLKYLEVEMTGVLVSNVSIGGGSGDMPTETVTLSYTKVKYNYIPRKKDSGAGTGNQAISHDLTTRTVS